MVGGLASRERRYEIEIQFVWQSRIKIRSVYRFVLYLSEIREITFQVD